jgi:Pyridoxamine 5'-phosphate oxidase
MATWADLEAASPDLARAGERLFRAFTLVFLATVRADGGPRVHPVTATVHDGGLYVFLVRGTPKRRDLLRDPRYALHSFPSFPGGTVASYVDDELILFGKARTERSTRRAATARRSTSAGRLWTKRHALGAAEPCPERPRPGTDPRGSAGTDSSHVVRAL